MLTEALPPLAIVLAAIGGLLFGGLLCALFMQRPLNRLRVEREVLHARLKDQAALASERQEALALAEAQLGQTFSKLSSDSLARNSRNFLVLARQTLGREQQTAESLLEKKAQAVETLVKPLTEALEQNRKHIEAVERDRHRSFGDITQQIRSMRDASEQLRGETANLVGALKRPEVRGRWGEMTLRRVVELAGMVEHCDFSQQVQSGDGSARPDLIVRLPEERELVVDAKVPLDAYLAAVEATGGEAREEHLRRHAAQVAEHVRGLAARKYWASFRKAPEFVILFLPGDQFLSAALGVRPDLLDKALSERVIVATPSSLVALLKTVGYGWQQMRLARNAEVIRDIGEQLHRRIATFSEHLARVGEGLRKGVDAYNAAVGSLERQVLPGARRFSELGVQERKPLADLPPVTSLPRKPAGSDSDEPLAADEATTEPSS